MPKNNFISSGGLNKDADKYYFPKGDYLDAKNEKFSEGIRL